MSGPRTYHLRMPKSSMPSEKLFVVEMSAKQAKLGGYIA